MVVVSMARTREQRFVWVVFECFSMFICWHEVDLYTTAKVSSSTPRNALGGESSRHDGPFVVCTGGHSTTGTATAGVLVTLFLVCCQLNPACVKMRCLENTRGRRISPEIAIKVRHLVLITTSTVYPSVPISSIPRDLRVRTAIASLRIPAKCPLRHHSDPAEALNNQSLRFVSSLIRLIKTFFLVFRTSS
jgi:hypothetical protein